jgi:hypothetical protein
VLMQGDITAGTLAGLGGIGGTIQLEVPQEQLAQAQEILRKHSDERANERLHTEDDESDPEREEGGPIIQREDEELAEEETERLSPEAVAARAWRAAVLGLFLCPPILHLYSLFVLADLTTLRGTLTPTGKRKMYLALFLDVGIISVATCDVLGLYLFG